MSGAPQLAVVGFEQSDSWRAALEAAVRPEFLVWPLVLPAGSPLASPVCGVPDCRRVGHHTPWGRFEARLCSSHWERWLRDGRPGRTDEWLSMLPLPLVHAVERCTVTGCVRSAAAGGRGMCDSHGRQWRAAGRPEPGRFAATASPAVACDARCAAPGCGFPVRSGRSHGLCDAHASRFKAWRLKHGQPLERYLAWLRAREETAALTGLTLPAAPLLAMELRFALQCRHDEGGGLILPARWRRMVRRLDEFGVGSLFDRGWEWWSAQRTEQGRTPAWMFFVNYAWGRLMAFRVRLGLDDPWAPDFWNTRWLPIDRPAGRDVGLDWRPIEPAWLRELAKRWARHRLRSGLSPGHVYTVRLAVMRLVEFCRLAGWPLDDPGCLTRELFDAFLDHVRCLEGGPDHKRGLAGGVKQLLEETHDLGWISLRNPRVYLPGELPRRGDRLPRALPAAVLKRLNDPAALGLLPTDKRAAVLVLIDCGLRATDTARLRIDAVIYGSDGAPYLRYFNHKRRREAIVPISERAVEAIATQRTAVRERFPDCEWLFPQLLANGRGKRPRDYTFIEKTVCGWGEKLDLCDEHGEPYRLTPHAFRHTYATGLVNNDVDLFSVQSLLDHDSPEMTWIYARMSNQTLRRKWEQGQQRINIRGEVVTLDTDGELSDAAWAKEQIARARQSLPNGWCGLPLQQTCPHPNACLTCPAFLTGQAFLPQHREQLARTEQLIEHGKRNGNQRLVEINEATRVNLVAIIARAEQLEREQAEKPEEEAGDAAA